MRWAVPLLALGVALWFFPEKTGASESGVKKSVRYAAFGLLTVYVFEFDPSKVEARLLFPREGGTLSPVREMAGCQEAAVCVNGPFFMTDNRPIGLLVSEGRRIQPVKDISWGIFWVGKDGKAHIQRKKEYLASTQEGAVQFALQSGPTVMWDGAIRADLGSGIARRVGIGLKLDGTVVLLVFPWPVSLGEMARFSKEQVGVATLMNLDGGGSAQLFVPGDYSMRVNGEPVAVGIGLYPR